MRSRAGRRSVAIGAAALCVLSVVVVQAQAIPSTFLELDGNVVSDSTGTYDWSNNGTLATSANGTVTRDGTGGLFDGGKFNGATTPPTAPALTTAAAADASIADAQFKVDPLSVDSTSCGTGDPTAYTGAGSETNGGLLSADTFGTSSVPNKDDLSNVYAAAHIASGVNEVFFGAERVINNGDSHIDFEFLQSSVTIPNACSGTFSGNRTQGDFLLSVDFSSGGTLGTPILYKWQCDKTFNGAHDNTVCNPPAHGQSVPHYEATGSTAIKLKVNDPVTAIGCGGWACRNSDGTQATTIAQNELMEGGIDLRQLGFTGCVSTFLPHTRSSQSFTAVLKDFEVIPFSTCAHPTITTAIANASGTPLTLDSSGVAHTTIGTTLRDTSALHGAVGIPSGTVSYTLYTAADCGGTATDLTPTPNAFVSGAPPNSSTFQFNNAGTYYFKASATFNDGRNLGTPNSGCNAEPVVVAPNNPTIATVIKASDGVSNPPTVNGVPTVSIGTTLRDKATLTGQSSNATGTVTYKLFSDSTCTTLVSNLTPNPSALTGTPPQPPVSNTYTFNTAGSFWFYAEYSGDTNNTNADGSTPIVASCSAEPLVVSPNPVTIATVIKAADGVTDPPKVGGVPTVTIGTTLRDTATLTGATATATGTVTYKVFNNSTCTGTTAATGLIADLTPSPNALTGNPAQPPASNTFTFNNAGNYWFYAEYSGDANNVATDGTKPIKASCSAEPLVVSPNNPVPHSAPVVQVKDTFSVTGLTNSATGSVVVGVFTDSGCTTRASGNSDASFLLTGNVSGGSYSNETTYFTAGSGTTYYFKISYVGDSNNSGFTDCTESATATTVSKA